jgi:hypothetical protein
MTILPALAVAFAAFCVWLTVRIINRRERWAKWTLVPAILIAYPLSFGPACWLSTTSDQSGDIVSSVYFPVLMMDAWGPEWLSDQIRLYANANYEYYVRFYKRGWRPCIAFE